MEKIRYTIVVILLLLSIVISAIQETQLDKTCKYLLSNKNNLILNKGNKFVLNNFSKETIRSVSFENIEGIKIEIKQVTQTAVINPIFAYIPSGVNQYFIANEIKDFKNNKLT